MADPLFDYLSSAPLSQAQRADLWDLVTSAADENDLAERLQTLELPGNIKADLWDFKASSRRSPAQGGAGMGVGAPGAAPAGAPEPGILDTALGVGRGLVKSLGNTVIGAGEMVLGGADRPAATMFDLAMQAGGRLARAGIQRFTGQDAAAQAATIAAGRQAMEPRGAAETVGRVTGDIGQAIIPGRAISSTAASMAASAPRWANPIRAAVEGVAGGAMGQIQGGGDQALIGAGASAAVPVAGAVARNARRVFSGANTPELAEAVDWATRQGVPMDTATATGSRVARIAQETAGRTIGGGKVAEPFMIARDTALARVGRELADRASTAAASPESAGAALRKTVLDRITKLSDEADNAYNALRSLEASNVQKVRQAIEVTDEAGKTARQMVTMDVPMPVDLKAAKDALRPIYERMMRQMPVTQRQASVPLHALENILNSPRYMPASVIDLDLSAIKSLARVGEGEVRDLGQGLAASAVKVLDDAVTEAVRKAGPEAEAALRAGRAATRQKYDVADLFATMADEPVQVFERATFRNDKGIAKLRELAKVAPDEMPKIGRAWIENAMDFASRDPARRFQGADKLFRDWHNLGPETKKVLFPDAGLRQDLDRFFMIAKRMHEVPNPSGTAAALNITQLATSFPGWAIAKLMYSPAGRKVFLHSMSTGKMEPAVQQLTRIMSTTQAPAMVAAAGQEP